MTSPASTDSVPPQLSAGPRPAPGPAADEGLARRLRALACTAPLHDLDARKANLAGEYSVYGMAEVALAAIDLVTLNMDFDTGADHDQIVARLIPRIAAQAPRRPVPEHERVARWVLENLINIGSVDRGFRAVYGTFASDGTYVRRDYDFKLIEEVPGPGGSVYLRTTDEAVNVLVGALDTDVTSAQIAAEVKLEVLISRGRLADAQLAAEQARYRTVQYSETLRRALDATRRNVRAVDWLNTVPDMIAEALDHVADRYRHENAILTNIRKARDESEDPEQKRRAAELVDIVKDCIRRHTQLQSRLLEAGPLFRAEQDRQAFATPMTTSGTDLYGHLLAPVLPLALEGAVRVTDAFFARGTGLRTPVSVRVGDLVDILLTPPMEREHLGAEMPEPDLIATPVTSKSYRSISLITTTSIWPRNSSMKRFLTGTPLSKEIQPRQRRSIYFDNLGASFDLIFIDGGHSYEIVRADIANMQKLAGPDSLVVIDDLTPWLEWGKGPTKAWSEAINSGSVQQLELYQDGVKVDKTKPPGERAWALGRYNAT